MDMNEYQRQSGLTAKYPESGEGSAMALAYVGLGLGEAGEIQNKIKKILRDSNGVVSDEVRADLAKEAGDLMWYLARLGVEIGYPLANIAEANLAKLQDRSRRGVISGSGDDR